ncbi:hypothetical protein AMECASPLE_027133 [Ameca splendens]|uniref:Uncharacterized protein n=1 Tax=Ameca splendens TaxID=208324 RepID=A0ABV1A1W0_9TELE
MILLWKTYHFSPKSQRELHAVGQMLGVTISNPSSVKGGDDEEESGQYAATLQHMSHLAASSPCPDVKGRAKKIKFEMERADVCAFSHLWLMFSQNLGVSAEPYKQMI